MRPTTIDEVAGRQAHRLTRRPLKVECVQAELRCTRRQVLDEHHLPGRCLDDLVVGRRRNEREHLLQWSLDIRQRDRSIQRLPRDHARRLWRALGCRPARHGSNRPRRRSTGQQSVRRRGTCSIVVNARKVCAASSRTDPDAEARQLPLMRFDLARSSSAAWPRRLRTPLSPQRDVEAPILQGPQRVRLVVDAEVRQEMTTSIAPTEGLGRRHAMHHLSDAALVHAILGPRAGKVLYATDLDRGHAARHLANAMSMRVPGGVGDDLRMPGDDVVEPSLLSGSSPKYSSWRCPEIHC